MITVKQLPENFWSNPTMKSSADLQYISQQDAYFAQAICPDYRFRVPGLALSAEPHLLVYIYVSHKCLQIKYKTHTKYTSEDLHS